MRGIEVARTIDDVEALRPAWQRIGSRLPSSDIDFFLAYARHAPQVLRPHVVVLEENGEPAGIAVARVEEGSNSRRLGYARGFTPRVRMLTVVVGGLLAPDEETSARLVQAVHGSIGRKEVDLVRFRALRPGAPAHDAARRMAPPVRREHFRPPVVRRRSAIQGSVEEFLAARSKEQRRHVRRYGKRLEQAYGDEIEIARLHGRADLDRLFADSERVYRQTYQAGLGVGFSGDELDRRLTETCMERGWFRGYVLSLDAQPVAFWHGNAYAGTFWCSATGFDPASAEHRPGTYLLMRVIEDLCADEAVHTIDFGLGDADYKRHFSDQCWVGQDVGVFARTPRAVAAHLAQTAVRGTGAAARSALVHSGRLADVRRAWRGHVTPHARRRPA